MIEIFEITDGLKTDALAKRFGLGVLPADRVFVMREDDEIGLGVLGLCCGVVIIKTIYVSPGFPFSYFDLLARSLLGILRDLSPIKIRIEKYNAYFERFGFQPSGGGMEIMSSKIDLRGVCHSSGEGSPLRSE